MLLIGFASITSLICTYLDYKSYRESKTFSAFISTTTTFLFVISFFVIIDGLKKQDRINTVFYASTSYDRLNTISIDFREDGSYKFCKHKFFGDSYYKRGRYAFSDSIIYLDKSNLNDLIVSNKFLMKTIAQMDSTKKQGLLEVISGFPKLDNSPEILLFQIDDNGDTISSAISLRVNKHILTVRQ